MTLGAGFCIALERIEGNSKNKKEVDGNGGKLKVQKRGSEIHESLRLRKNVPFSLTTHFQSIAILDEISIDSVIFIINVDIISINLSDC